MICAVCVQVRVRGLVCKRDEMCWDIRCVVFMYARVRVNPACAGMLALSMDERVCGNVLECVRCLVACSESSCLLYTFEGLLF